MSLQVAQWKTLQLGLDIHCKLKDRNRSTYADADNQMKSALRLLLMAGNEDMANHLFTLLNEQDDALNPHAAPTIVRNLLFGQECLLLSALVGNHPKFYLQPRQFNLAHVNLLQGLGLTGIPSGPMQHKTVRQLITQVAF